MRLSNMKILFNKSIDFLKKHAPKIASFIFVAITTLVIVLTYLDREKQELSFIVEATDKVMDLESAPSLTDLKVTVGDKDIKVLYLLKAKIQNTGNKAIQLEDLYEQKISLATQDMSTVIVSLYPEQEPYFRSTQYGYYNHSLFLKPDLLNPDDFIQLYIYFTQEGDIKLPVFETSIINGVTKTIDNR